MSEDQKSIQQQRSIPLSEKQRNSERSPSLHGEEQDEIKSIQKKKSTFNQPREELGDGKPESPGGRLDNRLSVERSKNDSVISPSVISPSKRNMQNEENKEVLENVIEEKTRMSPSHLIAKKLSFKDEKMNLKPLSQFEECLECLDERQGLLQLFTFLSVRELFSFLAVNQGVYRRYYKPVWSAIFCRYYNISVPNPLISRKIMPKILKEDIVNRSTFLEKLLKNQGNISKKNQQQRIVEKGTSSIRTDKLLEKQIIQWNPLISAGDSETGESCIGIALSNFYVSYYFIDKKLVLWRMKENSESLVLLEMLHSLDDVLKDCYIEADRYLMLKFEREAESKESFHTLYCIDSLNIKETKGTNHIKNSAFLTIYIDNVTPNMNMGVRKSILKDPNEDDIKRLFTVEENLEERHVRLISDTLPCNFNVVKVLKKIQLICCIDYDNSMMLLLDITGQEQYRLVPLRYCKPILSVHVVSKGEKEYLIVVSNQELAELCVYREADKLIFESKRHKLPMTFQTNIKTFCLGKQNSGTRGLIVLYDDQKWVLYETFRGVLGIQEIREWFKPTERVKIGNIWIQEKRTKNGKIKERVFVEIEVVRPGKEWAGFFEMLVFKARADKLLNREHDGKFKEVMRLRLEEDILYRQKIVRCLNYKVLLIGYFASTNALENFFVVKLWTREKKGEEAQEVMEIKRGVLLREPPGHKKITMKSEMENGKVKMTVVGNGKFNERFTYIFDVDNAWDVVGYEGKTKLKELI